MLTGPQYIAEERAKAAAQRLKQAASFVLLSSKQPLFQKRMGTGANAVLVRYEWPGVVSVYDTATGELLAASEPGKPDVLRSDLCGTSPNNPIA